MKLKSSNYKAHTKVSSYVICVVITAVTLMTAFGVLYVPFRQCSAHYVDYRIAATSQNDTRVVAARTQHLTYDECTDDKQRYDVINAILNNASFTVLQKRRDTVYHSLCDANGGVCLPVSILLVFLFLAVCVTALCKGLELCFTCCFRGRHSFLQSLGLKYDLTKTLDRNPNTTRVDPNDDSGKDAYTLINGLIGDTWLYTDQLGRDALNLKHTGIKIRHVYAINNPDRHQQFEISINNFTRHRSNATLNETSSTPVARLLTRSLSQQEIKRANSSYARLNSNDSQSSDCSSSISCGAPVMTSPRTSVLTSASACELTRMSTRSSSSSGRGGGCGGGGGRLSRQSSKIGSQSLATISDVPSIYQRYFDNEEIFLFHGTRIENVKKIIDNGFSLDKASAGSLYGEGIYLTDSCQKADQYCDAAHARKKHTLAMLVVRTALGRVGLYEECARDSDLSKTFDTVIAGKGKRFCEVVKYNPTQCYPAFVVIYDRCYGDSVKISDAV